MFWFLWCCVDDEEMAADVLRAAELYSKKVSFFFCWEVFDEWNRESWILDAWPWFLFHLKSWIWETNGSPWNRPCCFWSGDCVNRPEPWKSQAPVSVTAAPEFVLHREGSSTLWLAVCSLGLGLIVIFLLVFSVFQSKKGTEPSDHGLSFSFKVQRGVRERQVRCR